MYDAILCINMEVRYVWRSPKASRTLSRLLYIYNRYMSILWNLPVLGGIGAISNTVSATGKICLNDALRNKHAPSRGKHSYFHVHILCDPDAFPLSSCTALDWSASVLDSLNMLGPACEWEYTEHESAGRTSTYIICTNQAFTTLRVYALSGANKMLTGVVLLLSMGPFLVNVVCCPITKIICTLLIENAITEYNVPDCTHQSTAAIRLQ